MVELDTVRESREGNKIVQDTVGESGESIVVELDTLGENVEGNKGVQDTVGERGELYETQLLRVEKVAR